MISPVISEITKWLSNTDNSNEMIEEFKNDINKLLSSDDYSIFFTSSIYESNSWIISSLLNISLSYVKPRNPIKFITACGT